MKTIRTKRDWLLPTALILFLLEVVLAPFAAQMTYAGGSETPDHTLTYTTGKLTWDGSTDLDPDTGVAKLRLFSDTYSHVAGENGEPVVAPGTQGTNTVRLKNNGDDSIAYVAVLYRMKEEPSLPVEPSLAADEAFSAADDYPLPPRVGEEQVVAAVTGEVGAGGLQDFRVTWRWAYYEDDARDQADTRLGNKAAEAQADQVTAGLYIVVVEDSFHGHNDPDDPGDPDDPHSPGGSGGDKQYLSPYVPDTGDSSRIFAYLVLMAVSGVLMLLLLLERRKEEP